MMTKANITALMLITILLATAPALIQQPNVQAVVSNDNWPMFQHDPAHTGATISAGPIKPNIF